MKVTEKFGGLHPHASLAFVIDTEWLSAADQPPVGIPAEVWELGKGLIPSLSGKVAKNRDGEWAVMETRHENAGQAGPGRTVIKRGWVLG